MRNSNWLNKHQEEALEPSREICDAHHHLWDYPDSRYLADDYIKDISSGHNITSTVYVECGSKYREEGPDFLRSVGEVDFVIDSVTSFNGNNSSSTRICNAIVGYANLTDKNSTKTLDELIDASNLLVGVRHASAWDKNKNIKNAHTHPVEMLFGNSDFKRGFAELEKRNLSFDAWLYHPQIPELTELARNFPNQVIVLDHLGGPVGIGPYAGKRKEIFQSWKKNIRCLAAYPNVFAKLGGLLMSLSGFGLHKRNKPPTSTEIATLTRDYYLFMIDTFGPTRCMFESNFPMDKVSCSYNVLWNSFKKITHALSENDKESLYKKTAQKVYKIRD